MSKPRSIHRRATSMVVLVTLIFSLHLGVSRAEEPTPLPPLPEITPAELKELATDPTCNCKKPTAEEQKILDEDPKGGLGKLGAITEDDLKGALGDLETTQKDLAARAADLMAQVNLGSSIAPKYHVHARYQLRPPREVPVGNSIVRGVTWEEMEAYYKVRAPDVVLQSEGLYTLDAFFKTMRSEKDKSVKAEPALQYLSEAELEGLVAQTEKWSAADDEETVLGVRAYKSTVDKKPVYVLLIGKKTGIVYRFNEKLAYVQNYEPGIPVLGKLKIYEAATSISNLGFGNVTTAQWYTAALKHMLDNYKAETEGLRNLILYEILSVLPLSSTLVELEKIKNSAAGASYGKLGMNLFRDIGLVTIFIPGGAAFAVGLVADGIAVVFAFAIDDKDKWSMLAWTAGAAGIVAAARIGTVLRAVVRLAKLGKMQLPKAYAATLAAYEKYLAALAKWRELRKKKCLKIAQAPKPPAPAPVPPAPVAPQPPVVKPPEAPAPTTALVEGVTTTLDGLTEIATDFIAPDASTTTVSTTSTTETTPTTETTADFIWVPTTTGDECCSGDLGWIAEWFGTGAVLPPTTTQDPSTPGQDHDALLGPDL